MKTLTALASATVLFAGCALPALADDASSASSAASSEMSSASSEMSSASSEMPSSEMSNPSEMETGVDNWGQLISSIQTGAAFALPSLTDSTTINVVTVSSIKANGNTNALDNALKKNQDKVTALQASVEANATLKAKLDAAGYTSSQVVAVITQADGSVTVVIKD